MAFACVDADYRESLCGELAMKFLKSRHFRTTLYTPGGPEVEQDNFVLQGAQRYFPAIRGAANELWRNGAAGIGGQVEFLQQFGELTPARPRSADDCRDRDEGTYYFSHGRGFLRLVD